MSTTWSSWLLVGIEHTDAEFTGDLMEQPADGWHFVCCRAFHNGRVIWRQCFHLAEQLAEIHVTFAGTAILQLQRQAILDPDVLGVTAYDVPPQYFKMASNGVGGVKYSFARYPVGRVVITFDPG